MTETSPTPAPVASESFPEFDAPPFVPPAPSSALNEGVPARTAAAPPEPAKPAENEGGAPNSETPAAPAPAGPKPGEEPPAPEAGEPEPGPFSFAGRTFKDSAAAEHYLKTMEGRAKAEAKRVAETEQKLTEAARAATYYKAEAEKKAQTPETPPAPKAPEKSFLETLPWPAIRKLHEDEGFDAALFYALQQTTGHLEKNFEAKLKAALEPVQKERDEVKLRDHVTDLFQAAEDFMEADGTTPVYPELREGPDTQAALSRIWVTLDPQFALTERGVDYAILRLRAERAGVKPPKPPAPIPAPAPTAETLAAAANPAPEPLNGGGVPRQQPGGIEGARSKRVLGDGHRPRLTPSGESLGFID